MNSRQTLISVSTLLVVGSTISATVQTTLTQAEREHKVSYSRNRSPATWVPVQDLLQRQPFDQCIPKAYRIHDFMKENFAELLAPVTIVARNGRSATNPFQLREVSEDDERRQLGFYFCDRYQIRIRSDSHRVTSVGGIFPGVRADGPTISEGRLAQLAQELATIVGAKLPGHEYRCDVIFGEEGDDVTVNYVACLPGTKIYLGPGLSGNFDRKTGVPLHVQFSYEIPPYEPPFRDLIGNEEAYGRAISLAYDRVPWTSYRVLPLTPSLTVPDYGANQVNRSPRHLVLIAANKRCLVTSVIVTPVTGSNKLTKWFAFIFDSQTRELLAIAQEPKGVFGADSKPLENQLKLREPIALPNLLLKIPLVPHRDAEAFPSGLPKVAVRQGKVTFAAALDVAKNLLWIEGRAYKVTRAFTSGLRKAFHVK